MQKSGSHEPQDALRFGRPAAFTPSPHDSGMQLQTLPTQTSSPEQVPQSSSSPQPGYALLSTWSQS